MTEGSLCAMGGLTPMPVRSAITHFPDDFLARQPIPLHISARTEGKP
jgi:formate dehydrogenase iron-sulfur subunit